MLTHFNDANDFSALSGADELRQREEQSARRERVVVSIAIAGLGIVALIWLGLLGRVLWKLQADDVDAAAIASQCPAIADDQSRLECYDRDARRADPWPAKGARAPLVFHQKQPAPQSR